MNISSLLSPDTPRGRLNTHGEDEHNTPEVYSTSDVPIQAPSPIHPLNQAALWETNGYDVESVEKAMSKSSSSSSGMGGYYDPIHDQEPTAELSPRARRMGMGMGIDAYDPVHSNMVPSNQFHRHHSTAKMGAPSHHRTSHQVTPLGPPPIPQPSYQQHQHQHQQSTVHHHSSDAGVKPAYPNVLNELTAEKSYSTASYYSTGNGLGEPPRSEHHQWNPAPEIHSRHPEIPISHNSPQKRRKRVWEEEPDESVQRRVMEQSLSPLRSPSPVLPPPSPPQPQLEVPHEPEPEPQPQQEPEPEPQQESAPEPMEQDNETYEKPAGKPTLAKWIPDRIQEVRMLLEKYPLYKPAHLELIALLRRKNVVFASRESQSELESVRNYACEKMQLGEEEWFKWLEDEIAVCQPYDLEAMLKVIDLCVRAIEEQPMSAKLWQVYVQFVETQYRATHQDSSRNGKISAEEAEIAEGMAEMFTQEMLFNVYAQAAEATKNHITQSHLLWNRYLELLLEDLDSQFSESKLNHCRNAFLTRLKTPHPDIDQTFAAFSTFITRYENATYEKTMVATNKLYIQSKFKYQDREMQELKLKRAKEAADDEPSDENINYEWYAWQEYLQCEIALPKRKQDIDLICALFERCIMRYDFKGDSMWEWYLDFMAEKANRSPRVLPILERATHAFPALPSFWSRYLVAMEARFKTFEEMQDVKNRAVDTLSKVGEAALLDILYTWSGIIKRRVVEGQAGMSEDERASNLAEIKSYMKEFRNLDAEARIERLFISLCTQLQSPNLDAARKTWKAVVANGSRAKSSKLWLKYYQWELQFGPRSDAAGVLRRACAKAGTIDDPAAIFEAYATHVAEWGDVTEAEEYHWKVRKWRENLPQVVAPVVVQATEATQVAQPEVTFNAPAATVPNAELTSPNKRRRSIGAEDGIPPSKKSKAVAAVEELALEPVPEQPQSGKRDRENSTAVVKNLPVDIKELRLRQFFRECGEINSIKVVAEPDGATATATIEFESKEDVLAAQTKDMKSIDGQAIEVTIGAGLTLYVTNFPPSADEEYIKELFKEHGEIVDVRFPSLKYNTHRRFCYVQFLSADSARAATKLDGKKLGPKETLVVKISDPTHKQERSGPIYSGREVFLRNIDFKASDSDIRALFEKELGEGTVETVRLPSKIPGRHQGFGFVVFTTKEDAEKALELNNTQLKERALSIRLSGTNFSKKPDSGIVKDLNGEHAAASPGVMSDHPSPTTADGKPSQPPSMEVIQRKTLAILNLPDTVNDTRLRELFEKHGSLRKVQLRPEHQGAIIEYDDVQDAGKAGLALEGYKFPGMTEGIRFGTVKELKRQTSEVKVEKKERPKGKGKGKSKENGGAKDSSGASGIFGAPMQALRSTYGVATRGQKRRGGLGFVSSLGRTVKEDGESSAEKKPGEATKDTSTPAEAPKAKSNSDFRSLFLKK